MIEGIICCLLGVFGGSLATWGIMSYRHENKRICLDVKQHDDGLICGTFVQAPRYRTTIMKWDGTSWVPLNE